ncbi:MAG TPA: prepilin-type N-terminal cleavage/methylation domain-containing protein [bacterium]|nr:prepilin-type N-terminal cleavage/methylation domain-containing protein [bacterium]
MNSVKKTNMKISEKGFSLIEILISLVLVGFCISLVLLIVDNYRNFTKLQKKNSTISAVSVFEELQNDREKIMSAEKENVSGKREMNGSIIEWKLVSKKVYDDSNDLFELRFKILNQKSDREFITIVNLKKK